MEIGGWSLGYKGRRCWVNCSRNLFPRFSTYVVMIHQRHLHRYRLVCDRYSTFPLLGVSSPWLLLAVSFTRHFPLLAITQRFLYSTFPMKGITCIFTQAFHYPTFQLLDVSASPSLNFKVPFFNWTCICTLKIFTNNKSNFAQLSVNSLNVSVMNVSCSFNI